MEAPPTANCDTLFTLTSAGEGKMELDDWDLSAEELDSLERDAFRQIAQRNSSTSTSNPTSASLPFHRNTQHPQQQWQHPQQRRQAHSQPHVPPVPRFDLGVPRFNPATWVLIPSCFPKAESEFRSNEDGVADVIVVGAGVAGAALAHTLGKEGWRVHVIERDLTEPDRIVDVLLQPGGFLKLIELGLEDCVEEIDSQKVFGYAIFKDGKNTRLSYPLEKFHSDVSGRSFHNGCFIQRMREKVASLPNVRLEQGTVTSLLEENGVVKGVRYKKKSGEEMSACAPLTIVCDGCFSNLRRSLCDPKIDVPSYFVGTGIGELQPPLRKSRACYSGTN